MNPSGKKLEPKLKLEMSFEEGLERFLRVTTKELQQTIETGKTGKPLIHKKPNRKRAKQTG